MASPLRRTAAVFAALAGCLLAAPAAPAQQPPAPAPEHGGLLLTVSGAGNTWIRGVLLNCPSGIGNHPAGPHACAALERAAGDPDRLAPEPRPCSREYDPVTATAYGTWQGRAVRWERTYANSCELDVRTGPVFRF
ncbi:protease inhibitor [Streptomyces sp. A7024]|uniref:Protease inhibitor n=1 Tax=Streptomyces coryli TaxID=1128680 RepID=A0A6G4UBG4_9ACTN|nr:SSI family serine proteinase inhibitor [Streptomyces coryli]NGN68667.1 protease inhibitor [Streptomyces coryli]